MARNRPYRAYQRSLYVTKDELERLREIKNLYEADMKRRADWGDFLLFLGYAYLMGRNLLSPPDVNEKEE